ncbi:hypothetical protein AAC387_Pa02g1104 [Persea americana]
MAHVSFSTLIVLIAAVLFSVASAQDSAAAPSPGMDAGSGFSLPVSGALLCSSLLFSILAIVRKERERERGDY